MKWERWIASNLDVATRSGDEFTTRCVFHDDRSPSMSVNARKGVFYCHSCHASGDMHKLSRRMNSRLTSDASLDELLKDIRSIQSDTEPVRRYPDGWLSQFDHEHPYWSERGFKRSTIQRFQLGYDDQKNCVTIPLRDGNGHVIGVIRRRLDGGWPRYLYPKGFALRTYLWGEWLARASTYGSRTLVITEGSLDAIAVWEAGIPAVAMLGSRLTREQAALILRLNKRRIVVFTDNDSAGHHAVETVAAGLRGVLIDVVVYEDGWGSDPASLSVDERRAAVKRSVSVKDWHPA